MLIITHAGNLLLEFLFNWITEKVFEHIHVNFLQDVNLCIYDKSLCCCFIIVICAWLLPNQTEQWCRIWHLGAQRKAVYCKWSFAVDCWPAATYIWAEQDHSEEPTPPGPSRRWRREYHSLLVSCKGNYCWLKLLNICLLAPQSTL